MGGIHDYGLTQAFKVPEIAIGLIVAGSILMLLSFGGLIGVIKDMKILLVLFIVVLMLITLAELGLGITAYTLADEKSVAIQLDKVWPKFSDSVHRLVQDNFMCCGRNGTQDTKAVCPVGGIGHGCIPSFAHWVSTRIDILDIVSIVSAVVQIVVIIFAILLVMAISQRRESDTVPLLSSHRIIHVH